MISNAVSNKHIRAARALLGWTRETLRDESGVSVQTIKRIETDGPEKCKYKTVQDVIAAFVKAGITFTPGGPQLFDSEEGR